MPYGVSPLSHFDGATDIKNRYPLLGDWEVIRAARQCRVVPLLTRATSG